MSAATAQSSCPFCPHPEHTGKKCLFCKCKGKPGFLSRFLDSLGNAIGNAKFGGN